MNYIDPIISLIANHSSVKLVTFNNPLINDYTVVIAAHQKKNLLNPNKSSLKSFEIKKTVVERI